MAKQAGPVTAFVIGTLFLAVGGALAYFLGWPMVDNANASKSWPSTSGTITVAKVDSHRNRENQTMYRPQVEYTYTVDGVEHEGAQVWVDGGWSTNNSGSVRRIVASYPVGSQTEVFYDPQAPEICALRVGPTWLTYLPLAMGVIFFLVGALVAGSGLVKLLLGAFMIGAAATVAATRPGSSSSRKHDPAFDRSSFPASGHGADDDQGDDGIHIG